MFFCTEFSDKNATKLLKKIDGLGDIDLCYFDDPTELYIMSLPRIHNNPFCFHRYLSKSTSESSTDKPKRDTSQLSTSMSKYTEKLS